MTASLHSLALVLLHRPHLFPTSSSAQGRALAEQFGGTFVSSLDEAGAVASTSAACSHGHGLRVVISTLPAAAQLTIPASLLASGHGPPPVVLDVVYKPAETPLLRQAKEAGCPVVQVGRGGHVHISLPLFVCVPHSSSRQRIQPLLEWLATSGQILCLWPSRIRTTTPLNK